MLFRSHRLVTLVAAGGSGKTTLALHLAADRRSAFADLSSLPIGSGADLVWTAVARGLGLDENEERALPDLVAQRLAASPTLVVLDNCEHLLDGAAAVASRLSTLPGATLLATSREALAVPGEVTLRLGPLEPEAAVALFLERAATAAPDLQPDPAVVATLCERLDRLPLAIELAAARLAVFELDDLVHRLDRVLDLLEGGNRTTGRHRSVRNAIEWSHDLLTDDDRVTHRRLAVLAGPSRLDTIEAVVGDLPNGSVAASVARLCDASLLQRTGRTYRQLDLIRDHAREQLANSDDTPGVTDRFLAWAEGRLAAHDVDPDVLAAHEALLATRHPALDRFETTITSVLADAGRWTDFAAVLERRATVTGHARAARLAAEMWWARWMDDSCGRLLQLAVAIATQTGDDREWAITSACIIENSVRFRAMFPLEYQPTDPGALVPRIEAIAARTPDDLELLGHAAIARAWHDRTFDPATIEQYEADGMPAVLCSSLWDAAANGAWMSVDADATLDTLRRRAELIEPHRSSYGRPRLEWLDILSMSTDVNIHAGRLDDAEKWARVLLDEARDPDMRWGTLGRNCQIAFMRGEFDQCLALAEEMRAGWETAGRPTAGYMLTAWSEVAAALGYRNDPRSAEWFEHARLVGRLHPGGFTVADMLRLDVLVHHGRTEEARQSVPTVWAFTPGFFVDLRYAMAAEIFGGQYLDEASRISPNDPFANGILKRARGDLEGAYTTFMGMGARYQAARTARLLGGERADWAAQVYRELGLSTD